MVGLSPLITSHPSLFQQAPVRSSSRCYPAFNLLMTRSLGFGSKASNSNRPVQTRFRCAYTSRLKLARYFKSLTHNTKGTPSPAHQIASRFVVFFLKKCLQIRDSDLKDGLRLFVGIRFQELFHSPRRGAFHLSLTVLVRYRSLRST